MKKENRKMMITFHQTICLITKEKWYLFNYFVVIIVSIFFHTALCFYLFFLLFWMSISIFFNIFCCLISCQSKIMKWIWDVGIIESHGMYNINYFCTILLIMIIFFVNTNNKILIFFIIPLIFFWRKFIIPLIVINIFFPSYN